MIPRLATMSRRGRTPRRPRAERRSISATIAWPDTSRLDSALSRASMTPGRSAVAARPRRHGTRPIAARPRSRRPAAAERSIPESTQLPLEGLQAPIPSGPHVGQPGGRPPEPAGDHPVANLPAVPLGVEQAGRRQSGQVLDDGLARHRIAGGQFRGGQRPLAGQLVEEPTPGGVSQGRKDGVDVGSGRGRLPSVRPDTPVRPRHSRQARTPSRAGVASPAQAITRRPSHAVQPGWEPPDRARAKPAALDSTCRS